MVQPTHLVDSEDHLGLKPLEAQLRECYGRTAYSHKTHEKCADIYHGRLRILKITQIALSAVTTGGLIAALLGNSHLSTGLAAIASTILLALNTYSKENDLGMLSQKHAQAAGDLWHVRESYLSLLADLADRNVDFDAIREKRNALQHELKNIYKTSPRTLPKAYQVAQSALKLHEELTFSDEEIDAMLPPHLRKR